MDDLIKRLTAALPLLDGLKTGQDCEEYAFAKASGFQAMTYCPEAFEALRALPDAIARIAQLEADRAEANKALLSVLNAVRDYLPPDGISAHDCLTRVVGAVDNPEINPVIRRLEDGRS